VRDVEDDDERERAEKEGTKQGEGTFSRSVSPVSPSAPLRALLCDAAGEKQENEAPAGSNEETLATISSERNKITYEIHVHAFATA
jgi:hypothetical protein